MKLTLNMDLDNAAYCYEEQFMPNGSRDLDAIRQTVIDAFDVCSHMITPGYTQTIRDPNGNSIGEWKIDD